MGDLISRQAVLDVVRKWFDKIHLNGDICLDGIVSLPSVENNGEWILDETDNSVECNKCGCQIYPNDILHGDVHFCPNCGARMKVRKQNELRNK